MDLRSKVKLSVCVDVKGHIVLIYFCMCDRQVLAGKRGKQKSWYYSFVHLTPLFEKFKYKCFFTVNLFDFAGKSQNTDGETREFRHEKLLE